MIDVLIKRVQIPTFSRLGRSEHYGCTVEQAVLPQVHLDEVEILLQQLGLLSRLVNDVDLVADDDYRYSQVHF